jgi:hypothetical protein
VIQKSSQFHIVPPCGKKFGEPRSQIELEISCGDFRLAKNILPTRDNLSKKSNSFGKYLAFMSKWS